MSMIHKAYCFDTKAFDNDLREIITKCVDGNNLSELRSFICDNVEFLSSPYSFDALDEDWQDELENGEIQELSDFALTRYYDVSDDIGLEESWNSLLESLKAIKMLNDYSYYVIGEEFSVGDFCLDPGGMGLGFVDVNEITNIKEELIEKRDYFGKAIQKTKVDTIYELTTEEIENAYSQLIDIYEQAEKNQKGLMFTF